MKNPGKWDENDLWEMVMAGTQENIELDFKESASLQWSCGAAAKASLAYTCRLMHR